MDIARWERIKALFHEALDHPEDLRDRHLEAACGSDAELRAEVESLLRAHAQPGSFLEWHASIPADLRGDPDTSASRTGERLGAYELVRHLGSGGMGTVYLARRVDGLFSQDVAIKLVKRGMDTDAILRRFHAERQILAGLDHPNISRLLDGGATVDGLPYFVMEHIDGEPIDVYCRRHRLSLQRRLELFLAVCDAVQYAHRNLVVHRDLKPRNILVGRTGQPKLVDFGIAKFLGPGPQATRTEALIMTPEYASPEQVRGEPVTTATDVHALGILLYQLLAGHNPFTHTPLPADELARAILEQTPPPPSQVVAGPVPARALRGDLDNITSMALRKDPARRYASAEWLAADVQRYLRHEPVSARPDSLAYRAGKFVRRHRLSVAVAAAFILSLGAFSVVTARQAMLVARERDVAAAERDKAKAVSDFLIDLFEVDPLADDESVSDTMPLREFLTRSEDKVRRELADRPEVKATLLRQLTRLYGNLGRLDHARELGEEALALRTSMGDTGSAELATTLTALATVQQEQGEYEVAEKNFRRVLAIREAIYQPANAEVAEAVNNLAVVLEKTRRPETVAEDEALTRRALALRTQIFGADHADTAQSLNNLAVFLYRRRGPGDLEEAEKLYRQAIDIRIRRIGARHPSVAITQNNYANVLRELGRHEEAEATFRTAIDNLSAALGPEHPWLSNMLVGLHKVLAARGDFAGAETALRRAMAIADKTLPPDHPARKDGQSALDDLLRRAGKAPPATGP